MNYVSDSDFLMLGIDRHLKGKRIVQTLLSPETIYGTEERYVGFLLEDGTAVWLAADPEGNGVGWLDIELPNKPSAQKNSEDKS